MYFRFSGTERDCERLRLALRGARERIGLDLRRAYRARPRRFRRACEGHRAGLDDTRVPLVRRLRGLEGHWNGLVRNMEAGLTGTSKEL
jgi:hypothetical protein